MYAWETISHDCLNWIILTVSFCIYLTGKCLITTLGMVAFEYNSWHGGVWLQLLAWWRLITTLGMVVFDYNSWHSGVWLQLLAWWCLITTLGMVVFDYNSWHGGVWLQLLAWWCLYVWQEATVMLWGDVKNNVEKKTVWIHTNKQVQHGTIVLI